MYDFQFFNGEIVPINAPVMQTTDLGLLRGYGIFDYFYVLNNVIRFKEDCLERFRNAAKVMDLEIPFSDLEIEQAIYDLLDANGKKEGGVRLVLTGGYTEDGFTPSKANFLIMQQPLSLYPETDYTEGLSLMTYEYKRDIPTVKTTNYSFAEKMRKTFIKKGTSDVLYFDNGLVRETTRANFFIVDENGTIITADEGILPGITRKQVLKIIARAGLPLELRAFSLEEMRSAKEAFITSATKGVMPVTNIDGVTINEGKVGPFSKKLHQMYLDHVEAYMSQVV